MNLYGNSYLNYQKNQRPTAITLICILGFIGSVLTVQMIFSGVAGQFSSWFPTYSGVVTLINLACMIMIGLWFSQRWAPHTYLILVLLNQLTLVIIDQWSWITLAVQMVIIIITYWHLNTKVRLGIQQLIRYSKRQIWAITVAYMVGIHNFYKGENKTLRIS